MPLRKRHWLLVLILLIIYELIVTSCNRRKEIIYTIELQKIFRYKSKSVSFIFRYDFTQDETNKYYAKMDSLDHIKIVDSISIKISSQ